MKSFEYKGYWYLPNKPDRKIAGILSFKDGESSTLELIGDIELYDNVIYALSGPKTYDVIWGVNEEAKKITLFNCNLINKHFNTNSDFPIKCLQSPRAQATIYPFYARRYTINLFLEFFVPYWRNINRQTVLQSYRMPLRTRLKNLPPRHSFPLSLLL